MSISVTTNPAKMFYDYLESFDPTGMVVTATFSDQSTAQATGFTYPKTSFATLGEQIIQLEYAYEGVTKTASLNVIVNPIEVAVPVQNGMPVYDGTAKTPSWTGYDSVKMTLSGETTGVNAGTYMVKFALAYGYQFSDGTDEATADWTINRAVISELPVQSNVLVANGTPQTPTWDNYDTSQLTITGDRFGTKASPYTATFTPKDNYQWWDGTTTAKEVAWTITSVIVTIPVQSGTLTYDGTEKTPTWDNFDQENSSVRVTPQTNSGTHTATFTLLAGMWPDGTTGKKTVNWIIGRDTLAAVPQQSGTLEYDGNPKTPSWDTNYDSNKMTVSVEAQINAGTGYTATFTPDSNHQWWDGSVVGKTATWTIGMGDKFDRSNDALFQAQRAADSAMQDMDAMNVDQEFRLTMLELGLTDLDI